MKNLKNEREEIDVRFFALELGGRQSQAVAHFNSCDNKHSEYQNLFVAREET